LFFHEFICWLHEFVCCFMKSSETANYKRATELEDIIRTKNSTISKLKKDLVVLEQKKNGNNRLLKVLVEEK
ncbi:hypothetical protein S83_011714, partial [Arachis hypogaea]